VYFDAERDVRFAKHIINSGDTIRAVARVFGVSKSTVHRDITKILKRNNPSLYKEVSAVLEKNKKERHLRGGAATKAKYEGLLTKKGY
jgi:putative DeoR family transcriptional regulator (stage III sporulation protein D)